MDRKLETGVVKRALIQAGFDQNEIRVTHGTGTAWGWLTVQAKIYHAPVCSCKIREHGTRDTGAECSKKWGDLHDRLIALTQKATGRHGDYDGRICIDMDFFTAVGEG